MVNKIIAKKYGKIEETVKVETIGSYEIVENNKEFKYHIRNYDKYCIRFYVIGNDAFYIWWGNNKGFSYKQQAERTMLNYMNGIGEDEKNWIELDSVEFWKDAVIPIFSGTVDTKKPLRIHKDDLTGCYVEKYKKYKSEIVNELASKDSLFRIVFSFVIEDEQVEVCKWKKLYENEGNAIVELKQMLGDKFQEIFIPEEEMEKRKQYQKLERKLDVFLTVFKFELDNRIKFQEIKPLDVETYGYRFVNLCGYQPIFNGCWNWDKHFYKTEKEAEEELKKLFKEHFDSLKKIEIDNSKEFEKAKKTSEVAEKTKKIMNVVLPILCIVALGFAILFVILGLPNQTQEFLGLSLVPISIAVVLAEILVKLKIKIKIPMLLYSIISLIILGIVCFIWFFFWGKSFGIVF